MSHIGPSPADDVVACADDQAAALLEEGWEPRDVALVTTRKCSRPTRARERGCGSYWENLWTGEDIFHATVAGFKGPARPSVVICDPDEPLKVSLELTAATGIRRISSGAPTSGTRARDRSLE